jgi:hypothetical protein
MPPYREYGAQTKELASRGLTLSGFLQASVQGNIS